jgi:hypothetical protein
MIDREKLHSAIIQAITPYAKETAPEHIDTEDEDPSNDPFIIETASFLSQEIIDSGLDITDDQADLDDEDLENLPLFHILAPHIPELLSTTETSTIISNILQIYTSPDPESETHSHTRYGPCEVSSRIFVIDIVMRSIYATYFPPSNSSLYPSNPLKTTRIYSC